MKIAIIGAGLSGITAANALQERFGQSANITIFEKSRGLGGRMSTRRTQAYEFDHGAQYFTAKDPRFQASVIRTIERGHIAPWESKARYIKNGKIEPDTGGHRFVSAPRMNSWIKAMTNDLDIRLSTRARRLAASNTGLTLEFNDSQSQHGFDYVIVATPAPQTADLLAGCGFAHMERLGAVKMQACFAVMAGLVRPLDLPWDTLRSADGPASWIAVNSAKPGRPDSAAALMIHAGPNWSDANVNRDKRELQSEILSAASALTQQDISKSDYITIHRWLYASVANGAGAPCLADQARGIIACGDWCLGGRVEGAYLSGVAAAEQVITWSASKGA